MKLILLPYFVFLLFLASAGVSKWQRARVLEYVFTHRSPVYDYLCAYSPVPPVLIAGTSTGKYSVIPGQLRQALRLSEEQVANISWDSATPLAVYAALRRHESSISSLGMMLYSVDDRVLSDTYYFARPVERVLWTYDEYALVRREMKFRDSFTLAYRTLFQHAFYPPTSCDYPATFHDHLTLRSTPFEEIPNEIVFPHLKRGPSLLQLDYLARIKQFVEAHGGTFLLFIAPRHESYLARRRSEGSSAYDSAFLAALKQSLGEDQLVFGGYDNAEFSADLSLFSDPVHVNHKGAVKFTRTLATALKENAFRPLRERDSYF